MLFHTISLHPLLPYEDTVKLHHYRSDWILSYWKSSLWKYFNDETENCGDLFTKDVDDSPRLDDREQTRSRSQLISHDVHRCGCFKRCRKGCVYQMNGNEWPCFNFRCCNRRNKSYPPLLQNKPPQTCETSNLD